MIENIIAQFEEQLIAIRRDLHANPELQFQEHRTAAMVADLLGQLGFEVTTGIESLA